MSNDAAWKYFCLWAQHPCRYDGSDLEEPWDVKTIKPKKRRKRKVTLSKAMHAAQREGLVVSGATITTEGITLAFGEETAVLPNGHNAWDDVQ
jgi:hypothetical protein